MEYITPGKELVINFLTFSLKSSKLKLDISELFNFSKASENVALYAPKFSSKFLEDGLIMLRKDSLEVVDTRVNFFALEPFSVPGEFTDFRLEEKEGGLDSDGGLSLLLTEIKAFLELVDLDDLGVPNNFVFELLSSFIINYKQNFNMIQWINGIDKIAQYQ